MSSEQSPELDPVMKEAIEWVALLKSGRATVEDAEKLKRWRAIAPAHENAFASAVRLWRDFRTVAEREGRPNGETAVVIAPRRRPIARRAFLGGAIAAAAAAAAVIRPPFDLWPSWSELRADYRTAKGERREVTLGRDVSMQLNTETSVAVRSTDKAPRIELIAGEAVISTNTPPEQPLVVTAAGGFIEAAQASLNARCIDSVVSVTCLAGTVAVKYQDKSIHLGLNEQISYSSSGFGPSSVVDPAIATSWQRGVLVFHDRALSDVVEEINRYRTGRIFIANRALGRRVVNATFHVDQLDTFFDQARELFGAKVTRLPGGVAVLG